MDELGYRLKHMVTPEDGFSIAYETDRYGLLQQGSRTFSHIVVFFSFREFKRLANLGNQKIKLHWVRK